MFFIQLGHCLHIYMIGAIIITQLKIITVEETNPKTLWFEPGKVQKGKLGSCKTYRNLWVRNE